jgi:hypothetical protein
MLAVAVGGNPAWGETLIKRTGVFKQAVNLRGCDSAWDSIGRAVTRSAEAMWEWTEHAGKDVGNWTVDQGKAYAELAKGRTGPFFDEVNKGWRTTGKAAVWAAERYVDNPMLNWVSAAGLVAEILPGGKVTNFLRKARKLQNTVTRAAADQAVRSVEGDIKELGGDAWNTLKRVTNPLEFAEELGRMTQKWSLGPFGVYATLGYVFTEDDPIAGVKKAALAYKRQYDLFSKYATGKGFAKAIMVETMKATLINEYKKRTTTGNMKSLSKKEKAAGALLVAATAGRFGQLVNDAGPTFKEGVLTRVSSLRVYADAGSGGKHDWTLWHPVVETSGLADCINLGDRVVRGYTRPTVFAVCGASAGRDKWWSRPVDYRLLWSDKCSGAHENGSIWVPVCKPGFKAVGFVAGTWGGTKPLPNQIACLKESMLTLARGRDVSLTWETDDYKSGAKFDVSALKRNVAGIKDVMWAVPGYGYWGNNSKKRDELLIIQTIRKFKGGGGTRLSRWAELKWEKIRPR